MVVVAGFVHEIQACPTNGKQGHYVAKLPTYCNEYS